MSDTALETIEFEKGGNKYRILVKYDRFTQNPRTMSGYSPIGLFAIPKGSKCADMCDEKWDYVVDEWLLTPNKDGQVPFFHGDAEWGEEASVAPIFLGPLGKAEHGPGSRLLYVGRTLNGDTWDSGQIGWVFSTAEAWEAWGHGKWIDTLENVEKLERMISAELKEYAQFLRGECYRYEFEKLVSGCEHGHEDEWVDADATFYGVCGFVGEYPTYGGCIRDACDQAGIPVPDKFKEREKRAEMANPVTKERPDAPVPPPGEDASHVVAETEVES